MKGPRKPKKTVYVAMQRDINGDCEYPNVAESEWEAANMVDGDENCGPVYIYERVSGPLKMEVKREAVVTPIEPKRKRSKK